MTAPQTGAPAPSAELPPLPPALVAIQALTRALRAQLDALDANVTAFATGMQASMARAEQQARRAAAPDAAVVMPPVFGGRPAVAATEEGALARIPERPASPAPEVS